MNEDPSIPSRFADSWIAVRVRTRDGRTLEERCTVLRGMAGHPPSRDDHLAKVRDCAFGIMPPGDVEMLIRTVEELARRRTIRPLMTLLRKAGTKRS